MKLIKYESKGFKWFGLSGIDTLSIDFTLPVQLLLGGNGSGKTSLLNRLTPLPATSQDFYNDGYERMTWIHRGMTYKLESVIAKESHHTFICGDDILNNKGTLTVQLELVAEHFNITKDIHNLLTGTTSFTTTPPAKIMNLLIKIINIDLDYGMKIYYNIKEKHRDTAGVLKHIRESLLSNKQKLSQVDINTEEHNALIPKLQKQITQLNSYISNKPYTDEYKTVNTKIATILNKYQDTYLGIEGYSSKDELVSLITTITADYNRTDGALKDCYNRLDKIYTRIRTYKDEVGDLSVEAIMANISDTDKQISRLKAALTDTYPIEEDVVQQYNSSVIYKDGLTSLYNTVGDINYYDQDIIDSTKLKLQEYKTTYLQAQQEYTRCSDIYENKKSLYDQSITCVYCGNINYVDGAPTLEKLELFLDNKNKANEWVKEVDSKLIAIQQELEAMYIYIRQKETILDFVHRYPLVNHILAIPTKSYLTNPSYVMNTISAYSNNLHIAVKLKEANDKVSNLNNILVNAKNSPISILEKEKEDIQIQIQELLTKLQDYKVLLDELKADIAPYLQLEKDVDILTELLQQKHILLEDYITVSLSDLAKKALDNSSDLLAQLISTQNSKKMITSTIDDYMQQERDVLDKQKHYKMLMDSLSPRGGIIGDQINAYLEMFMGEVNNILSKIFDYSIEVGTKQEGKELDFKFPLTIDGHTGSTIDKGSSGQQDVINLAFKIVLMSALGMTHYPLYLDEVGSSFDDKHRHKLGLYIEELIESSLVSQIFYISHLHSLHGGLSNYEAIVLYENNLRTKPPIYNQHVRIKYG